MVDKRARGLLVNTNATAGQTGFQPTGLSPEYLFNLGLTGFWGDTTDSATLFQTASGVAPAGPGDFCGLRLDKSQGLELGPDLVTNGDFATDDLTGWTNDSSAPASATVSEGKVVLQTSVGSNNDAEINQTVSFSETGYYLVKATVSDVVGNANVRINVVSGSVANLDADEIPEGEFSGFFIALSPGAAGLRVENVRNDADTSASLSDIQVTRLKGNHQYQTTTAAKPTVQIVDGVQALVLDDDDDSMLIDVPTGGWSGTFVQGTALGVIVGEIDVPAGPYQMPTDPNYAGPASDIHTVIVNESLPDGQVNGLAEWVGQRCPVADFASVSSLRSWFRGRSDLTSLDASRWSTGSVTDMVLFAFGCSSLLSLNVSGWDTSQVTDFRSFIRGCEKLVSFDPSGWDTSSATRLDNFALGCSSLTSLEVSSLDTSNVTNFSSFAEGCESLASLDVSGWDTSAVNNFLLFAFGCSALETITINGGSGSPFSDSPCIRYNNAFTNTNLSQQSYTDLVTAIEAAGTSNGTLNITGGTSTTTGAAQTAVDALRGRGWTVTTPDGY